MRMHAHSARAPAPGLRGSGAASSTLPAPLALQYFKYIVHCILPSSLPLEPVQDGLPPVYTISLGHTLSYKTDTTKRGFYHTRVFFFFLLLLLLRRPLSFPLMPTGPTIHFVRARRRNRVPSTCSHPASSQAHKDRDDTDDIGEHKARGNEYRGPRPAPNGSGGARPPKRLTTLSARPFLRRVLSIKSRASA